MSAVEYKNAGNKLCSLNRYEEAINYYNKAIAQNSEVAIYYSNRALCYLKLEDWQSAIKDCRQALSLEPNLIKAHFFLGQALAGTDQFNDALKHLQRAHELSKEQKMNYGDDIAHQIRLIKRRRWSKIEDEITQAEDKLRSYLLDLISKDKQRRIDDLNRETQSEEQQATTSTSQQQDGVGSKSTITKATEIEAECDNYADELEKMFTNLRSQRRIRDVPDYLCGKISFEIMQDPVITPSGVTYDRKDIEEHLKRVGHFDPITRQPLEATQLVSNLAMKEVVDAYLRDNEWALYY